MPENSLLIKSPEAASIDYLHVFVREQQSLDQHINNALPCLKKDGMLWVSWPKGSSSIETELNREKVRERLLRTDLVDIKVCAIDDDWSGLKFVYRKDRR